MPGSLVKICCSVNISQKRAKSANVMATASTVYSGDKPDGSGPRSWYEMRIPHSGSDRFRPSPLTSGTPTVTDAFKRCQLQPPFSEPERRRTRSASLANLERSSCCACLPVGPRAGDLRVARYGGRTVALSVARSGPRCKTLISVIHSWGLPNEGMGTVG